ncbi:GreA/GreB family elongation factor (plasmid) [Sinorhizobium chiapasense]|uniref:GreA/GreB family elongation factor n=1 Tax=Sinorhizobium chiapasense TaxID=501572 RepID=UPI002FE07A53
MSDRLQCYLTVNDHAVLREILDQRPRDSAYGRLLRRKLAQAEICSPQSVPNDVVTINSRVTFCVDAGVPRTANLVRNESQDFPNYTVSVGSLLGLGLLGLRAGRAIAVETETGGLQKINAITIAFQALALPGTPIVITSTLLSPRICWDRSPDAA